MRQGGRRTLWIAAMADRYSGVTVFQLRARTKDKFNPLMHTASDS
jgi:hypothetical protein